VNKKLIRLYTNLLKEGYKIEDYMLTSTELWIKLSNSFGAGFTTWIRFNEQ